MLTVGAYPKHFGTPFASSALICGMTWPFFADEAGLGMSTNQVFHFC